QQIGAGHDICFSARNSRRRISQGFTRWPRLPAERIQGHQRRYLRPPPLWFLLPQTNLAKPYLLCRFSADAQTKAPALRSIAPRPQDVDEAAHRQPLALG